MKKNQAKKRDPTENALNSGEQLRSGKNLEKKINPGNQGIIKRRNIRICPSSKRKAKAKYTYGILEKQFLIWFKKAAKEKGITGEVLLQYLERRLDNVVYRLGIAPTRAGARQLVSHRHITVNGEIVNIPSYTLRPGDIVGVREKSKSLEVIFDSLEANRHSRYPWLEWDSSLMAGKFVSIPERSDIPENIKEQLIVELYSK